MARWASIEERLAQIEKYKLPCKAIKGESPYVDGSHDVLQYFEGGIPNMIIPYGSYHPFYSSEFNIETAKRLAKAAGKGFVPEDFYEKNGDIINFKEHAIEVHCFCDEKFTYFVLMPSRKLTGNL